MTHKFNPQNLAKLESPERKKMLPPEETLIKMGLSRGMIMADIGAGTGYFSIPASRIVGTGGMIYAVDISTEMLQYLKERAESSGITNIHRVLSSEHDPALKDLSVDMVLMAFVLHELHDIKAYINTVLDMLKPLGTFGIIEWEKKSTPSGPPLDHRLSREETSQYLKEAGFTVTSTIGINSSHYALTALRS